MNPARHRNFSNGVNRMVNKMNKVNIISNGVKKLSLGILVLTLTLLIAGCSKAKVTDTLENDIAVYGVPETGVELDITEKNTLVATTTPGDVLYLKLLGEAASGKQWTVAAPTSGQQIMLKDHKIVGLGDEELEIFTDEWWLKIEETGEFSLQFDYGKPGQKVEDTFILKIISQ